MKKCGRTSLYLPGVLGARLQGDRARQVQRDLQTHEGNIETTTSRLHLNISVCLSEALTSPQKKPADKQIINIPSEP